MLSDNNIYKINSSKLFIKKGNIKISHKDYVCNLLNKLDNFKHNLYDQKEEYQLKILCLMSKFRIKNSYQDNQDDHPYTLSSSFVFNFIKYY